MVLKSDSNNFCFQRQDKKSSVLTVPINPDLIDEESEEIPEKENISENLNEENIPETLIQEAISGNSLDKNVSKNITEEKLKNKSIERDIAQDFSCEGKKYGERPSINYVTPLYPIFNPHPQWF